MTLEGKTVLITGAARRIGAALALYLAGKGADIIIHHGHSAEEAEQTAEMIQQAGRQAWLLQADLEEPDQAVDLIARAWEIRPLNGLINNAAIFEPLDWQQTTIADWQRTLNINLTAPFLLSQQLANRLDGAHGRILNILDWRALRPGADHLPYTISKAGLAALTQSLALALAPNITVNGLALGAILPPSSGGDERRILEKVPANRWADLDEVGHAAAFLLAGPEYITGEIIYLDGGRHLV